jgi:hypothetical protein
MAGCRAEELEIFGIRGRKRSQISSQEKTIRIMASFTQATKNFLFGAISPLWMNARFNKIICDGVAVVTGFQNAVPAITPIATFTALTITPAQLGANVFLPVATGVTPTITIPNPALAAGGVLWFFNDTIQTTSVIRITTTGGTACIKLLSRMNITAPTITIATAANVAINFSATAVAGAYIRLYCDGTLWRAEAACAVAGDITITA